LISAWWAQGCAPDPTGGPYSTLQILDVFRRPTFKKREEKGRKGREGRNKEKR